MRSGGCMGPHRRAGGRTAVRPYCRASLLPCVPTAVRGPHRRAGAAPPCGGRTAVRPYDGFHNGQRSWAVFWVTCVVTVPSLTFRI